MYIPKQFQITDTAWCHTLMRAQSFAAMITADDAGVPFATHLPILVDPARGPLGTLRGHVARANPHWRYVAAGRPTLVVFSGAHAYVSPSWYATHPSVPTWNYVAVHATGTGALVEDPEQVKTLLADLVRDLRERRADRVVLRGPGRGLPGGHAAGHRGLRDSHRAARGQGQAQPEPRRGGPGAHPRGARPRRTIRSRGRWRR